MLYGTAEFRKNFYIKLRQMTGIIFRAPGRIDATRVHARASAKRATGSGVRFGSKADICSAKWRCPLYPQKRTLRALFDHLVGTTLQRLRHGNAHRLRGLEIDEQLDFYCLLYR